MIPTNSLIAGQHQGRLVNWIIRHQVALFFALTFLFSWSILAVIAPFEDSTTYRRIVAIAGFGPSLAAIILSTITNTEPTRKVSFRREALFISILVLLAGIEWHNNIWWDHPYDLSLILVDLILVTLAALVITWSLPDRRGLVQWFKSAGRWRLWVWALIALGLWPLLVLASRLIAGKFGLPLPADPTWPDFPLPLILLQSFVWMALFGGPLAEEPGWRGFALPRLQSWYSPLVASIIVGFFWGLWHVPEHLLGVYAGGAFGSLIRLQDIPRAILFTWIFNRSKGSLLVMILFHTAVNTTSLFLSRSWEIAFILCTLLAVTVVFTDKMWKRLNPQLPVVNNI